MTLFSAIAELLVNYKTKKLDLVSFRCKYQIFYPQIQRTDARHPPDVSQRPVIYR